MSSATGTFHGRLTADPVLRRTPAGHPVANFTVAHTPSRRNDAGEWEDSGPTVFLAVSAWHELAENVAASLSKGDAAVVIGRLEVRHWETAEGEKRTELRCMAESVGVDLRWATAMVTRVTKGGAPVEEAPWATRAEARAA